MVTVLEPGREIAWARTEPFGGTLEWRYRFEPEGTGTRVTESLRGHQAAEPLSAGSSSTRSTV